MQLSPESPPDAVIRFWMAALSEAVTSYFPVQNEVVFAKDGGDCERRIKTE